MELRPPTAECARFELVGLVVADGIAHGDLSERGDVAHDVQRRLFVFRLVVRPRDVRRLFGCDVPLVGVVWRREFATSLIADKGRRQMACSRYEQMAPLTPSAPETNGLLHTEAVCSTTCGVELVQLSVDRGGIFSTAVAVFSLYPN